MSNALTTGQEGDRLSPLSALTQPILTIWWLDPAGAPFRSRIFPDPTPLPARQVLTGYAVASPPIPHFALVLQAIYVSTGRCLFPRIFPYSIDLSESSCMLPRMPRGRQGHGEVRRRCGGGECAAWRGEFW